MNLTFLWFWDDILWNFITIIVTCWAKTWHIPHFIKIEIRPEICISVFNRAAVKKMEAIGCLVPKLQRETHRTFCIVTVISPFNIVLHKVFVKMHLENHCLYMHVIFSVKNFMHFLVYMRKVANQEYRAFFEIDSSDDSTCRTLLEYYFSDV